VKIPFDETADVRKCLAVFPEKSQRPWHTKIVENIFSLSPSPSPIIYRNPIGSRTGIFTLLLPRPTRGAENGSARHDPWNRTLCSILEEMRKCYETRNFAQLHGLIEEAQTYGNRMEAKLFDVKDYERLKERYKQLKTKVDKGYAVRLSSPS